MKPKSLHLSGLLMLVGCSLVMAQRDTMEAEPVYDKEIKPVYVEELRYPPLARQARIRGAVVVRAKLDSQGNVVSTAAISGHELLIRASLENAKKWRFRPNAKSEVIIVYDFGLDESLCGVPG